MSRVSIKPDALADAFLYASAGAPSENQVWLCVDTGAFHYHTDIGDNFETLPDDIDDEEKYVLLPHKNDLDLGRQLVRDFTDEFLPDEYDQVEEIFHHRGAYRHFKDLLDRRDMLQTWHEFQNRREQEALREWCADNDIGLLD